MAGGQDMEAVIETRWVVHAGDLQTAADILARNVDAEYVSHSEIQEGLATPDGTWVSDLADELAARLASEPVSDWSVPPGEGAVGVALACEAGRPLAAAVVRFRVQRTRYAVLEDFAVEMRSRGRGIGQSFLAWIESEAGRAGMPCIYLESGAGNRAAHRFFEAAGFRTTSVVMRKAVLG